MGQIKVIQEQNSSCYASEGGRVPRQAVDETTRRVDVEVEAWSKLKR
jgi:hypothetical protein